MNQLNVFKNQIAEVQLVYRTKVKAEDRVKITSSRDAFSLISPYFEDVIEYRERCVMLLLNRTNRALGVMVLSDGGTAGSVLDPKMVFQAALKANAHGIILAHNHPSGDTKPSHADNEITKRMKEAGRLLELQLLDHVILTKEKYLSYADEGLL